MRIAAVEISESLQQGLDDLLGFLPRLVGFLLIMFVGYLVAKALQKVVSLALEKIGTDRALASGPAGSYVERVTPELSVEADRQGGVLVRAARRPVDCHHVARDQRIERLPGRRVRLPAECRGRDSHLRRGRRARRVARADGRRVLGDSPTGKLAATALPVLVMAIAVFMILNQLRIATDIVTITYAALMGAVALGMALALGSAGATWPRGCSRTRTGAARRSAAGAAGRRFPRGIQVSPQGKSARLASEASKPGAGPGRPAGRPGPSPSGSMPCPRPGRASCACRAARRRAPCPQVACPPRSPCRARARR